MKKDLLAVEAFKKILRKKIVKIAHNSGDFAIIKKGLSSLFEPKSLLAGCRLHSSNKNPENIIDSKVLTVNGTKVLKPELFAKDLIKIHEFHQQFRAEIHRIVKNQ
ncbi:MAG: hypothetical protein JSU07_09330 [Bacteroidetes bacterium]|nr:hypothetical protein [Bacteroidota bacterium]